MNSETENCHYVSRSITSPWEHEIPHRKRQLRVYSAETESVYYESSKKLFMRRNLLTPMEEKKFAAVIENPMGKFKFKHIDSTRIDDYTIYRSLYLYFFLQAGRYVRLTNEEVEGKTLSEFLKMTDAELNTVCEFMRQRFNILSLYVVDGHFLFFPELGFFSFPILCNNEQCSVNGFALPISSQRAICLIPHGPSIDDVNQSRNMLMHFSVGISKRNDKCLIPNELKEMDACLVVEKVKMFRASAVDHQKRCNKLNVLVQEMYQLSGLEFPEK